MFRTRLRCFVLVMVVGMSAGLLTQGILVAELADTQPESVLPAAVEQASRSREKAPKEATDDQIAEQERSRNNLRQLGIAMHEYHDVHGRFPPAAVYSKDGRPLYSWRVLLLPYLDQSKLF